MCTHKIFYVVSSTVIIVRPRQNYKTCYTAGVVLSRRTISKFAVTICSY